MQKETLNMLCCPVCKKDLDYQQEYLSCSNCSQSRNSLFPIHDGIVHFARNSELDPQDRYIQKIYNYFSLIYDAFLPPLFYLSGLKEIELRNDILAPIKNLGKGAILEVSVGTGTNLRLLKNRFPEARYYGLDISMGMLHKCLGNFKKWEMDADLFYGNGSTLPFKDNQFDVVLHVGGINSFADKKGALAEMHRVVKPGGNVVINDEGLSERKKKNWWSRIYFNLIFGLFASLERGDTEPPMDMVPDNARNIILDYIGNDYFWLLQFQKAARG